MATIVKSNKFRIAIFIAAFVAQLLIFQLQVFADHSITLPFAWVTPIASDKHAVCDNSPLDKSFPFKTSKPVVEHVGCWSSENSLAPLFNLALYALLASFIALSSNEIFEGQRQND